jgi:predicted transcriptional regulator
LGTIKASDETKRKLVSLAGELQAKTGRVTTMEDVILFLLEEHTRDVSEFLGPSVARAEKE